jgi:ribosome maturation factor RimP
VVPGFERRLQRVVEFDRADGLAVNQDLELAPSEFKPKLSLIVPG